MPNPGAQPFRALAHNGEINTLKGNINWMKIHEQDMSSPLFKNVKDLKPAPTSPGPQLRFLESS